MSDRKPAVMRLNKTKYNRVLTLGANGLGNTLCVAMLLELGRDNSAAELAEWIELFYDEIKVY